jgi:hypothetical protein
MWSYVRRDPTQHGPFTLALVLATLALLTACGGPAQEVVAGYELRHAPNATEGLPFTIEIVAVGSRGTTPLRTFTGPVTLSASAGILTGYIADLQAGTATIETSLVAVQAPVTLRAEGSGATGESQVLVAPLSALPGDPSAAAEEALPWIAFVPRADDYLPSHPAAPAWDVAVNTIGMSFTLGTTVAEANEVLASVNAHVVGAGPGVTGAVESILMLRVPTTTHQELQALLTTLRAHPRVRVAAPDVALEDPDFEPTTSDVTRSLAQPGGHADWDLEDPAASGSWGVRAMRLPQAWNLLAALRKNEPTVRVGVLDLGVDTNHEDLQVTQNLTPNAAPHPHGTHVAGIIRARSDNDLGIDGVNPFAQLIVKEFGYLILGATPLLKMKSMGDQMINEFELFTTTATVRVLNVSLGYPSPPDYTLPSSDEAKAIVSAHGRLIATRFQQRPLAPIVVAAAGNASNKHANKPQPAQYTSPWANAGLEHGVDRIIVVEAIDTNLARADFSNIGGHVSAPGVGILSTTPGNTYNRESGTSMAAPHVTGLVSLLLAIDPSLTATDIKTLLTRNARDTTPHPTHGGQPSGMVDAFATIMDLDRHRNDAAILTMLLDIDDGTPDGNQRIHQLNGTTNQDEDADEDGGIGDGRIDMSDFRRWRDWYLQTNATTAEDLLALDLDGGNEHPKRDVNGNGRWGTPTQEGRFPRGDFNGDGKLHPTDTSYLPGALDATVSDLEALSWLFDDPHYDATDLADRVESLDVEVWPRYLLDDPNVTKVRSYVRPPNATAPAEERIHADDGNPESPAHWAHRHIYTLPKSLYENGFVIVVEGYDAGGNLILSADTEFTSATNFSFKLGADHFVDPIACDPTPATRNTLRTSSNHEQCEEPAPRGVYRRTSKVYLRAAAQILSGEKPQATEATDVQEVDVGDVIDYSGAVSASVTSFCDHYWLNDVPPVSGTVTADATATFSLRMGDEPDLLLGFEGEVFLTGSRLPYPGSLSSWCGDTVAQASLWDLNFDVIGGNVLMRVTSEYQADHPDWGYVIVIDLVRKKEIVFTPKTPGSVAEEHVLSPGRYVAEGHGILDTQRTGSGGQATRTVRHRFDVSFEMIE